MPATTVKEYLAALPADRREALEKVREVILANLDGGPDGKSGYEEGIQYGMIGYYVPHRVFPAGYHCDPKQPLPFAALSSMKNYMALHLMCVYGNEEHRARFEEAWAKSGKKLDMGKACLRFKKVDDLALDVLGETIRRVPADKYIAHYTAILNGPRPDRSKAAKKSSKKAPAVKKAATRGIAAKRPKSSKPRTGTGRGKG
ncbi:MAG: DUF1801 domain-containing protein [Phycisphaerales bacterium]|jgi:hypothetical protein